MKQLYLSKGLLLCLFCCISMYLQADPPSPFYQGDLTKLKKQARKTDTPYFVYFQLADCESCSEMNQHTWKNPQVSRYIAQHYLGYQMKAITPAQGKKIMDDYGIFVYPALLVFDANGKLEKHIEGYVDAKTVLAVLSGKPICAPAASEQTPGKPQNRNIPFTSRPVKAGKTMPVATSIRKTTPASSHATPTAMASKDLERFRRLPALRTPAKTSVQTTNVSTQSTSNVQNDVYKKYERMRTTAAPTGQSTTTVVRPSSSRPAVVSTRPYSPATRNASAVTRISPSRKATGNTHNRTAYRQLPKTKAVSPVSRTTRSQSKTQIASAATRPTSYKPVVDPRFRRYDPWKSLAPLAGINYSLILDAYTTSDQVLLQIEMVKRYWPNSIWVYQEETTGVYRLALGNFRSEDQAQQYADLLMRSQNLQAAVKDLYEVMAPNKERPAQGP